MTEDPRLRLLGNQATSEVASAVLSRLDQTEVIVDVAPGADRAALVAVAAFVTMVARLFPNVVIHSPNQLPTNWWGARSWDDLLARLAAVRPSADTVATRGVRVGFGTPDGDCDLYVGGGDWDVLLGDVPVELSTDSDHALGVHAAACLAVSQVLVRTLGDLGFPGVAAVGRVETNLIDHGLHKADCDFEATAERQPRPGVGDGEQRAYAFAGIGSVGSSALALLAMACSDHLNPGTGLAGAVSVTTIDKDSFDPDRNPFRYPALIGDEDTEKATTLAATLRGLGISADGIDEDVATWNQAKPDAGWRGVLVSSVDTITGRLDVADVLAERTLSAGVAGTALHVQWERFADGYACPFCDFVRADPPLTQAGVFSELTGIPVARVLALLQEGAVMEEADVDVAVASGRLPAHRRAALVGARFSDLVRQVYAEAPVGSGSGPEADVVAVASPQVSWFAGVLIAAELVKDLLGLPPVTRRVDLDVAGVPAGLVRSVQQDQTGTCVCHSGTRVHWYRRLYTAEPGAEPDAEPVTRATAGELSEPPSSSAPSPILGS